MKGLRLGARKPIKSNAKTKLKNIDHSFLINKKMNNLINEYQRIEKNL